MRVRAYDSKTQGLVEVGPEDGTARMYVCGITPYDATHLGHANTYVAFDLLNRVWRDAGLLVNYVQNVTDVDDPLIERADRDGVGWRELADSQIELFREDMEALNVLAPASYIGAVEAIPLIVELIQRHQREGIVYPVEDPTDPEHPDLYFEQAADASFLSLSHLTPDEAHRCSPSGAETPSGPASATRTPRSCGAPSGRVSPPGTPRSAAAVRAGTWSARPSPSTGSDRPSTCRAAAATWSSRTTRCRPPRGR